MLQCLIIIKQNENTTKTSQLANLFSGNEDYATEQGHILKENSSVDRNITTTNSFDQRFFKARRQSESFTVLPNLLERYMANLS